MSLFVTMNHFHVEPARAAEFEEHWKRRRTYLAEVPGFVSFALLRGEEPGHYVSHASWASRAAFEDWTRSDAFRRAHSQARLPEGLLRGHPKLAVYEAVLESDPKSAS